MDTTMLKDKMVQMATKLGMSPETIKAMESDTMSAAAKEPETASVTVAVVKKPEDEMAMNYDLKDEEIDKMSESEAKAMLKKWRDLMMKDKPEAPAAPEKKEQTVAERVMNASTFK